MVYVVWMGIGVVGMFLVGVVFYGDFVLLVCYFGVVFIVVGVVVFKLVY